MRTLRGEVADRTKHCAGEQQERGDLQRRQACLEKRFVSRMAQHDARGDGEGDEAEAAKEDDVQSGDALARPEEREDQPGDERKECQLYGERRGARR